MNDRCATLNMVADLLEYCGQPMEPEALGRIGYWLNRELAAVQALLEELP